MSRHSFNVRRLRVLQYTLIFAAILCVQGGFTQPPAAEPVRWVKGNLHTHSLWSDGDDYPEMIVDWYKQHEYQFLALSDHNTLLAGQKWTDPATNKGGPAALEKYIARLGPKW